MTTPRFFPALRVTIALQTAALLIQAITAGLLLSTPDGRMLHGASALAVAVTSLLHLGAAILVWRPGGGSARAILPAAMLLVFTLVQMVLGMAHMKALHVPIGVLMFGASVMQLVQIWSSPRPVAAVAA
ncbi:hypothetical protein SAMN05216276_102194 [Streptosporangium subroseum]|uniref:Uncharacterized protein n=1 Tax=Streptosporangium subroseum TaxID=106412 RepID=A0A239J482_9ACTN|nr:hypothetical protein [Streptosporangium subroseum]SNT00278.1 hypothetical protein SAMN05216276_102194 [Streptosporangium subroseum]